MLSRIANATRVVARSTATRTFCAPTAAALKSASSSRQSNQHNRTHYNSNNSRHSFRFAGGVIALLSGGIVVAACDKSAEPNPSVNYSQLRQELEDLLEKEGYDDGSYGPVLVRLAWHSAGTYDKYKKKYGSTGATMRFASEAGHGANAGLDVARNLLEPVKQRYPGVTYADLYTLAGCVAIESMGGPKIEWRAGRPDAKDESSCPPNGNLPDASKGAPHIRDIFYRMGFNDREIVALSGAHALGRCHTTRSGFSGPWTRAPTTFSNEYFRLLLEETWTPKKWNGPFQYENSKSGGDLMMLPTDLALIEDPAFKRYVEAYAGDENVFFHDFAKAFQKLMELGVNFDKRA